jgi:hypothetical protein
MVKYSSTLLASHVSQNMEGEIIENGFNENLPESGMENSFIENVDSTVLQDIGFCFWSPSFIEKVEGGFMENLDRPAIRLRDGISVSQVSSGEMLINDQEKTELQVNRQGADCTDELGTFIGGIIEECFKRAMERVGDSSEECPIQNCEDSYPGITVQSGVICAVEDMNRTKDEATMTCDPVIGLENQSLNIEKEKTRNCEDPLVPLLSLYNKSLKTNSHIVAMKTDSFGSESGCPGLQNLSSNPVEPDRGVHLSSLEMAEFDSKSESLTSASNIAGDSHFCCVISCESNRIMDTASNGNGKRLSECLEQCTRDIRSDQEKLDLDSGTSLTDEPSGGDVANISRSDSAEHGAVGHSADLTFEKVDSPELSSVGKCANVPDQNVANTFELVMKNGLIGCCQSDKFETLPTDTFGIKHKFEKNGKVFTSNLLKSDLENGASSAKLPEKSKSGSPQSTEDGPGTDLTWDSDYDVIKDFNECLVEAERYPEITTSSEFCECLVSEEDEMKKRGRGGSRLPSIMETSDEGLVEEPAPEETQDVDSEDVLEETVIPVEHVTVEQSIAIGDIVITTDDPAVGGDDHAMSFDSQHSKFLQDFAEKAIDLPVHSVVEKRATEFTKISSVTHQQIPPSDTSDTEQIDTSTKPAFVPKLFMPELGETSPENSDSSGISPSDLDNLQNRTKQLLNGHSAVPVTLSVEIRDSTADSAEPSPATTQDSGFDFRRKSRDPSLSESGSENYNLERSSYYTCDDTGDVWSPTICSPGERFEKSILHGKEKLVSFLQDVPEITLQLDSTKPVIINQEST